MLRHRLSSIPLLAGLALVGPGLARADEPTSSPEASKPFVVQLRGDTTAETVIPQLVEAGREQLATACAPTPGASVRIFNPLAEGSYEDVACSTILDGGESVGQTSEALTSGERIGQVEQARSPIGLGCTAFVGLAALFANYALCNRPTAQQPEACHAVNDAGMFGLGVACAFI